MLKILVTGYNEPFTITGSYSREDEKYIYLVDGGVKKRVPHSRIVVIEDLSDLMEEPLPIPIELPAEQTKASMAEAIAKAAIQAKAGKPIVLPTVAPSAVVQIPENLVDVVVIFHGDIQESLTMKIKDKYIDGHHLPTLLKEINLNPEVQAILNRGYSFANAPVVSGRNISIRLKKTQETIEGAGAVFQRAGMIGKMMNSPMFSPPKKEYVNSFATTIGLGSAMSTSPFEQAIDLEPELDPEGPREDDSHVHSSSEAIGD